MTLQKIMLVAIAAVGLLLALVLGTAVISGGAIAEAKDKAIKVRVLLYSGKPDPTYELTDPQMIGKLKASIDGAKRLDGFSKETVIPANIGYKGILVENPEMMAGLPARFAVYKGKMEVMDAQRRFLEDKDGMIEKMLMDEAVRKGVIEDVILKRMKREK